MMEFKLLGVSCTYTGRELRRGWVREKTGLGGDAAVGFVGPCRVANEDLVDKEDAAAGAFIAAASMAHVIVEHPGCPLGEGVLRQRLLVCILCELLRRRGVQSSRLGDDVMVDQRKLTVSVTAPAPASVLIHLGINVDPQGAPVPAIGLQELGIDPEALLADLLTGYAGELEGCRRATGKVREVP